MTEQIEQLIFSLAGPLLPIAPAAIVAGMAIVLGALVWLVVTENRKPAPAVLGIDDASGGRQRTLGYWLVLLLMLIAAGAALRLVGLGEKSLNHMEVYIPGIPLPPVISEPPPRHDWFSALTWGFFKEPHPVGYFLAMFGWTELFGTGVAALRAPSALLGVLSIPVVYRLGALAYDWKVGLIAAGFLSLHGFHVHTSMWARMFVPECFFGLVATWLLLEILRARRHRGLLEACYVLVALIGFNTEWFFWPLVGTHFLYACMHYRKDGETHRLVYLQVLMMILGAFTLSQVAATAGLAGSGARPSLTILQQFFSFGIFYHDDIWSNPPRTLPFAFVLGALALSVTLLWRGLTVRPQRADLPGKVRAPAWGPLCVAAVGITIVMLSVVPLATAHIAKTKYLPLVLVIVVFPLLALATFSVAVALAPRLRSWLDSLEAKSSLVAVLTSPIVLLALVPFLMVCFGALFRPMVDKQALIAFTPYLLIVIAAGARSLASSVVLAVPLAIVLVLLFVASVWHFHGMPQTNKDYAAIAKIITGRMKGNDVVFVRPGMWYATPLYYYLDPARLVGENYQAYSAKPNARIWLVLFHEEQPTPMISDALAGYTISDDVEVLGAHGMLYERH